MILKDVGTLELVEEQVTLIITNDNVVLPNGNCSNLVHGLSSSHSGTTKILLRQHDLFDRVGNNQSTFICSDQDIGSLLVLQVFSEIQAQVIGSSNHMLNLSVILFRREDIMRLQHIFVMLLSIAFNLFLFSLCIFAIFPNGQSLIVAHSDESDFDVFVLLIDMRINPHGIDDLVTKVGISN